MMGSGTGTGSLQLLDVESPRDWPEIARVMLESYEEPKEKLYDLFFPIQGTGENARQEALKEHAARLQDWDEHDDEAFWHKVVDSSTGEIVAGALWKIHHSNPFAQDESHPADWYPEGGARDFVTQAIGGFDAHRARMCQRPHVFLNIIFTHPKHRGRGAAALIINWGIERAKELNYEMFLDAFPHARRLYPKFGFGEMGVNEIKPTTDHPDQAWKDMEKYMGHMELYSMWRPKDGPYKSGESVKPWETS